MQTIIPFQWMCMNYIWLTIPHCEVDIFSFLFSICLQYSCSKYLKTKIQSGRSLNSYCFLNLQESKHSALALNKHLCVKWYICYSNRPLICNPTLWYPMTDHPKKLTEYNLQLLLKHIYKNYLIETIYFNETLKTPCPEANGWFINKIMTSSMEKALWQNAKTVSPCYDLLA